MKYQTLYRSDFTILSDGSSAFDSLLLNDGVSREKLHKVDSLEINYDLLNAYDVEAEEILEELKD